MSAEQTVETRSTDSPTESRKRSGGWLPYIVASLVLPCLTVWIALATFTPRYRASHLLESNTEFILYKDVMPVFHDLADTERAVVMNSVVLDSVLVDPDVLSVIDRDNLATAQQHLRRNLSVEEAGSSGRMLISYVHPDREAAAAICNAVASSYLRVRSSADQTRVTKLETLLVPEIDYWKAEVERLQGKYRDLWKAIAGRMQVPGADMQEIKMEQYKRLSHEIFDLESEIEVLQTIQQLKDRTLTSQTEDTEVDEEEVTEENQQDPNYSLLELKTRLEVLNNQLQPLARELALGNEQSTELTFIESDLERATGILNKLEDRAAAIRTERRQMVAVRSVAKATPPQTPANDIGLHSRVTFSAGAAFVLPLLLGALRPRKRVAAE
ncbi:MAG: hypothetical protein AAFX06_01690 [Planctomycetota bacterium]